MCGSVSSRRHCIKNLQTISKIDNVFGQVKRYTFTIIDIYYCHKSEIIFKKNIKPNRSKRRKQQQQYNDINSLYETWKQIDVKQKKKKNLIKRKHQFEINKPQEKVEVVKSGKKRIFVCSCVVPDWRKEEKTIYWLESANWKATNSEILCTNRRHTHIQNKCFALTKEQNCYSFVEDSLCCDGFLFRRSTQIVNAKNEKE